MNPRVDIVFKKIFGVDENKDLLISLINATVSEEDQVVDLKLLNPYNRQNFKDEKLSILDIKAEGRDGKRFNIEIQILDEKNYDKRALYYWAKMYTEQLGVRGNYTDLNKVIGIHILNFISIVDVEKYHNVFHITEKETGFVYFKDLELHTVELKKFSDTFNDKIGEVATQISNALDMWSAFLTRHDLLTPDKLIHHLNNPELKKALDVLSEMHFNPIEREVYEDHLKWLRIEASGLQKSEEKGFKKGRRQGKKEGIKQGLKQGKEEGIKQGKEEGLKQGKEEGLKQGKEEGIKQGKEEGLKQAQQAIALKMVANDASLEYISQVTGLSDREIAELREALDTVSP